MGAMTLLYFRRPRQVRKTHFAKWARPAAHPRRAALKEKNMTSSTPIVALTFRCERSRIRRYLAIAAAGGALLAGCSAGAQHSALPGVVGATAPASDVNRIAPQFRLAPRSAQNDLLHHVAGIKALRARANTVFASDFEGSSSTGFIESAPITKPPGGTLNPFFFGVEGPGGLAVFKGDLYIADSGESNILQLHRGSVTKTLDDSGEAPSDVTVSHGTVYVANIFSFPSLGPGSISIYTNGSLTPTSTLTSRSFFQVIGVKVDTAGDLFVNNNRKFFARGQVLEFKAGSSTGSVLRNIPVKIAGGLAIDPTTQDLLVVDQDAKAVTVYAPPYTGSAKATYPVPNGGSSVDVTLDNNASHLYFANVFGTIDVVSYPAGKFLGSYTAGSEPTGIALGPPQ
jgi:hypothetical protein